MACFVFLVDGLVISHLPYGPTAYFSLNNAVLRHDIEDRATISEAYPHIIASEFETKLVRWSHYSLKLLCVTGIETDFCCW